MVGIVQSTREIAVRTPLGQDKLLLTGFAGREVMSQLFRFDLNLLATNDTEVPFEKLLGQPMIVDLPCPRASGGSFTASSAKSPKDRARPTSPSIGPRWSRNSGC